MNLWKDVFARLSDQRRRREMRELRDGIIRDLSIEMHRLVSLEPWSQGEAPRVTQFTSVVRNASLANLNLKFFGYELARALASALPLPAGTVARHVGLGCKASVQADMENDWVAHWCAELKVPVVFHRKLWEQAFILQVLYENGFLNPGKRALGFGCGSEPLPSYFASQHLDVTVSDLGTEEARDRGWVDTHQHSAGRAESYHPEIVDRQIFEAKVNHRIVDMNSIPADLGGYDFCWSVCALEHLGSIEKGLRFLEASLETLKPGGLSVHTTEFNIDPDGPTFEEWPTVLFQQRHFQELATRLTAKGHRLAPLDFDTGDKPMDRFIDLPPWAHNLPTTMQGWSNDQPHMKVAVDGFVSTCFGLIIYKSDR